MKDKKIYIKAYLNHNLGDDLFIDVLVKRYPETQFYLYAPPGYRITFSHLKNLKVYETTMFGVRLFNKIFLKMGFGQDSFDHFLRNACNAIVQIGGSIFRISDKMYLQNIKKMLPLIKKGKKVFIIGSNFCKGFDEKFFLYVEDMDICYRCWKKNKKVVYYPLSKMTHVHQRSSQRLNKKTLIHLKSFFYFFRKNRFKIKSEAQHLTSAPQREKETFQLQPKVVPSK